MQEHEEREVEIKLESVWAIQNLSLVSSAYPTDFTAVVKTLTGDVLNLDHGRLDPNSLTNMLFLKEAAVQTLGNLAFDSKDLLLHILPSTKLITDLMALKRTTLTKACLWTLNNIAAQVTKSEFLLELQIGKTLEGTAKCYRGERAQNLTDGQKELLKELYWLT